MAEIESVISAVIETLGEKTGVNTIRAWPAGPKKRHAAPVITVGLRAGRGVSAGFAEYLGERYDDATAAYYETYGKRLELTLAADIYSPDDGVYGAGKCTDIASAVIGAMADMPEGIRVKKFTCGETAFDGDTGMFLCGTDIECACTLYADRTGEDELSGFTLRGDVV